MTVMISDEIDILLEKTSRSFYPTLKYLPKKIRGQIGLLYLLARVADTIADSKAGETNLLICLLYTSPSPRDQCLSRMPSSA